MSGLAYPVLPPFNIQMSRPMLLISLDFGYKEHISSKTLTPLESLQKQRKIASMYKTICNQFDNCAKGVRKLSTSTKSENDLWACLLSQLSGVAPSKPRQLQAHQWWSKDFYASAVQAKFMAQWELSECPPVIYHTSNPRSNQIRSDPIDSISVRSTGPVWIVHPNVLTSRTLSPLCISASISFRRSSCFQYSGCV
ncbi:hypothetical protein BDR07DRAFT_1494568 [Suillus spraguei]|nr:hypothetical protein BDR07DRAFT_1494568 [Suillus spraguei]